MMSSGCGSTESERPEGRRQEAGAGGRRQEEEQVASGRGDGRLADFSFFNFHFLFRTEGRLLWTEGRLLRTEGRLLRTEGRLLRTEGRLLWKTIYQWTRATNEK